MPALTAANDAIRAQNVTASEVGALLDKHPYTDAARIFDRLSAPAERGPQSEAMALGSFFEPYIARYLAVRNGLRLRANGRTLVHRSVPLCATPDYYVLGHSALAEIKLSSKQYQWTEETLQPYILWQARAQLAVTDRDTCIIAALVGSNFHTIMVRRDEHEELRLLRAVREFWDNHIMTGVRPSEPDMRLVTARVERS